MKEVTKIPQLIHSVCGIEVENCYVLVLVEEINTRKLKYCIFFLEILRIIDIIGKDYITLMMYWFES